MRQIIVALDASDPKINTIDFACYVARLTDSNLVCALIARIDEDNDEVENDSVITTTLTRANSYVAYTTGTDIIHKNRKLVKETCSNRGVASEFLPDIQLGLDELIKESRFSDLIIADPTISFQRRFEGIPTVFLEQLLKRTECPVFVAPERFEGCKEIVFAYDGGESAMFAIRQFTYFFPELTKIKLTVIEVAAASDRPFTQKPRLVQWLNKHYSNVEYKLLFGRPKDELFGYLLDKEKIIVVMGAFGRTMLSNVVSKSNAELILKAVNLPLFICHS